MSGPDRRLLAAGGVRAERSGAVVAVVLDRPEARNAQTPQTWAALHAVGQWVASLAPHDVRVVVLRAEGPSFSAGLDRAVLADTRSVLGDGDVDGTIAGFQGAFTWWREVPAVSIAAVGGHAVGAGFQLALACDLRLCADDARFAMRETSLGLVPDLAGTAPLVRAVGLPRALEVCLTGRWVDAPEAARWGLANLVVPRDDLGAATDDLVAALLAAPAESLVATLRLLRGAPDLSEAEQRVAERAAQATLLRSLSAQEPVVGARK